MTPTKVTFDYEKVRERIRLYEGEDDISDKEQGVRLGVSERQIRKARNGDLDAYLLDTMCVKGLGIHPGFVFREEWISDESVEEAERDAVEAEERLAKKQRRAKRSA